MVAQLSKNVSFKGFDVSDDEVYSYCTNDHDDNNIDSDTKEKSVDQIIASKETRDVVRLKLVVLIILTLSAISVGVFAYKFVYKSEQSKFHDNFSIDANKVLQTLGSSIENTFAALDSFSTSMISHSRRTNEKWPFVTIPDFGNKESKTFSMTRGVALAVTHLVESDQRTEWENYAWEHRSNVNDTLSIQETDPNYHGPISWDIPLQRSIHSDFFDIVPYNESRLFAPSWQSYPLSNESTAFNWDWLTDEDPDAFLHSIETKHAIIGEPYMLPDPENELDVMDAEYWANYFSHSVALGDDPMEPVSDILYPVIDAIDRIRIVDTINPSNESNISGNNNEKTREEKVVAVLSSSFYWRDALKNILPLGRNGIVVVYDNPCTVSFTYQLNGPKPTYLGRGDHHDSKYDYLGVHTNFFDLHSYSSFESLYTGLPISEEYCAFTINIYPSTAMENDFVTKNPMIFTSGAILIFVFTSIVFLIYDYKVERRQIVVMTTAVQSSAVISSLFPSHLHDKIFEQNRSNNDNACGDGGTNNDARNGTLLSSLSRGSSANQNNGKHSMKENGVSSRLTNDTPLAIESPPLADLYPDTTVFFADISGFTAWSSVRGPYEVFTLLETLYGEFDKVAKLRRVFKVETIGDSYVAVTGLPDPMKQHAVVMIKFGEDILHKMKRATRVLCKTLGPDTAELKLRIGVNSGPTTAGVLRGEKSRFQLFGDTVNTASRMESTGVPGKIQCSQKTADILIDSGKAHWLTKRDEMVHAKGKGSMETYWVKTLPSPAISLASTEASSVVDSDCSNRGNKSNLVTQTEKDKQLIEWNVDLFHRLLNNIASYRASLGGSNSLSSQDTMTSRLISDTEIQNEREGHKIPLHEVVEVINMPPINEYSIGQQECQQDKRNAISEIAFDQLNDYIRTIASLYRDNPFHSFEHASHVVMSTKHLLDRMVIPSSSNKSCTETSNGKTAQAITNMRFDPLTHFSIAFGALIHDVDHQGVSNMQLVQEEAPVATRYKDRCVAEQNSFDIAWRLLLEPTYNELRQCIFVSNDDLHHFRQVVINTVMATDIFDKDLKALRDERWEKAFDDQISQEIKDSDDNLNRKATIFIEHLIQASDVVHTMQHWNVYQKWNHRLFVEMYRAYDSGRSTKNTCDAWYDGELWFFDNYIIPLATKLKACGVFGANCDAFLDFARDNRLEWECKGRAIVSEWTNEVQKIDDIDVIVGDNDDEYILFDGNTSLSGLTEI